MDNWADYPRGYLYVIRIYCIISAQLVFRTCARKYIWIPLEPKWPIFWRIWPIEWKVNSPQKRGQLGSTCIYINLNIISLAPWPIQPFRSKHQNSRTSEIFFFKNSWHEQSSEQRGKTLVDWLLSQLTYFILFGQLVNYLVSWLLG